MALCLSGPSFCWAAEGTSPSDNTGPKPETEEDQSLSEMFIESNIAISEWLDGIAEGIDLFLVEKKITNRQNESNVKVDNSTYFAEGLNPSNSTSVGVNLRLPNVEQYWNLKFTTYDESQERGVRRTTQLRQRAPEQNYGASVGLFQKMGNVRTAFQPRVELTGPLKISHSLAFESVAEHKSLRFNPKLEFFASHSKGTGIFQALNFNFRLTRIYSITLINEGEYLDKGHHYAATNGIALGQMITRRSSMSYGVYLGFINRDNYHLENYTLAVTWSHVIFKKILDYSVTPQLIFPREQSFTGTPALVFNIGLNF